VEPLEALPNPPMEEKPFPWRLFWLLAMLMLLASLLLLPYALYITLASNPQLADKAATLRITTTIASLGQCILLYWPLALLGLLVAGRLGLGAPYLAAWLEGQPSPGRWTRILTPAAVIGFGSGVLVLLLSGLLSSLTAGELARLNATLPKNAVPPALDGFFAAISAGINEEILLRLFLLSSLAWVIQWLLTRRTRGHPSTAILWAANLLSAIAFGLLHMPNLAVMNVPISPYLIAYLVALNGLAGLGFGWLFFTYGLESAILAHFFIDLVLHVLPALLIGLT
jgi:membrane protease YdiL (CAAX protease family)